MSMAIAEWCNERKCKTRFNDTIQLWRWEKDKRVLSITATLEKNSKVSL